MKALTLYVLLGGTALMRLFSASGISLCLCECLSFYFTLFTPLYFQLSLSAQGAAATPAERGLRFLRARFTRVIFRRFFLACYLEEKSFLSVKVFLVKIPIFLTSISHFTFFFLLVSPTLRHRCGLYEEIPEQYSRVWVGAS